MFEWVRENEMLWRRGHRNFRDSKGKKALWDDKASQLMEEFPGEEFSGEKLLGWWKSMHTWYVKLLKKKSGQAARMHTDREVVIIEQCKFYEREVKHKGAAPMKSLALAPQAQAPEASGSESEEEAQLPLTQHTDNVVIPGTSQEATGEEEDSLTAMEVIAAKETVTPKTSRRRKRVIEDDEFLKEMRLSRELLTRIMDDRPKSSREAWITYLAMSLREMPEERYATVQKTINDLLTVDNTTAKRPSRPFSAPNLSPSKQHNQSQHQFSSNPQQFTQYQQHQFHQQQQPLNPHQQQQQPSPVTASAPASAPPSDDLSAMLRRAQSFDLQGEGDVHFNFSSMLNSSETDIAPNPDRGNEGSQQLRFCIL